MKPTQPTPSVSNSFTMRLAYPNRIGMFARIVNTIGKHGGDLCAVDIVTLDAKVMTRDIAVLDDCRRNTSNAWRANPSSSR
jgi:malate dehydrogenase (oxaloacetate-decarboxylating)